MTAFLARWWPALAGAALLAALLSLAFCNGKQAGKAGEVVKQQAREIDTQHDMAGAAENAAGFRVEDARKLDQQERELKDAKRGAQTDDALRIQRGCAILRQQGRDTKDIPACSGSEAGSRTSLPARGAGALPAGNR